MRVRQVAFAHFRKYIALRTRYYFVLTLDQRGYNGKMTFNHKKEELLLRVNNNLIFDTITDSVCLLFLNHSTLRNLFTNVNWPLRNCVDMCPWPHGTGFSYSSTNATTEESWVSRTRKKRLICGWVDLSLVWCWLIDYPLSLFFNPSCIVLLFCLFTDCIVLSSFCSSWQSNHAFLRKTWTGHEQNFIPC